MSAAVALTTRLFKVGSVSLPDPDPSLPPDKAVALYAGSYPQVITGELTGPTTGPNGEDIYEVERPVVKTKG